MKIAIWYNLPSGGAKRSLYDQVAGLLARGHEVELWRPPLPQAEYLDLGKLAKEHEVPIAEHARSHWFKPQRLYLNITAVNRFAQVMDEHCRACAEQIERGGFDLLFSNSDHWFHAPFIGRHLSLPKALYLHEPNRPFYEPWPTRLKWLLPPRQEWPSGRLGQLRTYLRTMITVHDAQVMAGEEVENARHFDRILVNSRFSRESVLRTYGVDSHVCYLGIDASRFEDRGLPREPLVMCVGSMTASKNAELLVRAVAGLPSERRPRFVWVYNVEEPDYLARVQGLAQELGVNLELRRMVTDAELIDLLNRTSAFLYAPRLEPFGLAPLEANACGAPVVAVAEGGVRETIEDGVNGLLVDSDPAQIAVGLDRIMMDTSFARRLGEGGARLVREKWSPSAAMDRLEAQLRATMEAKR